MKRPVPNICLTTPAPYIVQPFVQYNGAMKRPALNICLTPLHHTTFSFNESIGALDSDKKRLVLGSDGIVYTYIQCQGLLIEGVLLETSNNIWLDPSTA